MGLDMAEGAFTMKLVNIILKEGLITILIAAVLAIPGYVLMGKAGAVIAVMVVYIISYFRNGWHLMPRNPVNNIVYTLPEQAVELVKQVHMGRGIDPDSNITVSEEMHEKLMYPLTRELIELIGSTEYPVSESTFNYGLIDTERGSGEIRVTVQADIDYHDTSNQAEAHCHNVLIYITFEMTPDLGFRVISVEHN